MRRFSLLLCGGIGKIHASSIDNASQPHLFSATALLKKLHWRESDTPQCDDESDIQDEAMAFTMTIIALAAHLGTKVNRSQERFFSDFISIFPIPNGEKLKTWKLYHEALRSETNVFFYARQLGSLFSSHPDIHRQCILRMTQLATKGEYLNRQSFHFIMDLADACHLSDLTIQDIFTVALVPANKNEAIRWLRLDQINSVQALKKRYRNEMQAYHPDHLTQFARNHERDYLLGPVLAHRASMLSSAYQSLLPQAA